LKIKLLEKTSFGELCSLLRKVKLRNQEIFPYKEAEIVLKKVDFSQIYPSATYVLERNLIFLADLRNRFLKICQMDIFKLWNRIIFQTGKKDFVSMIPPIIEYSEEDDCFVILDGLHRLMLARLRRLDIFALYLYNVKSCFPSIPIGWKDVKISTQVPQIKRYCRPGINDSESNRYVLHRDLFPLTSNSSRVSSPVI